VIIESDTLLRWDREGFRPFWRLPSRPKATKPKIQREAIDRIQRMAKENLLWGFVFFIIELASRRVVDFRVTRHPNETWTTQPLREATPFGTRPKFLIRDNDNKFGGLFNRVAKRTGIQVMWSILATSGLIRGLQQIPEGARRAG